MVNSLAVYGLFSAPLICFADGHPLTCKLLSSTVQSLLHSAGYWVVKYSGKRPDWCCLNKIRNIFCVPDTKFVFATNVAHAGKQGNICVVNNVSATMCPRLSGPLARFPVY